MESSALNTDLQAFDELWLARHQPLRLASLEQQLEAAMATAGDADTEYSVFWRMARLAHFRAMQSEENGQSDVATRFFETGKAHAQRAVEANRHDVEGHFWLGVNALEASRRKGWMQAAGALKGAASHIERAMNQDEEYHFAGPLRVWARITHFKPLLLGGSIERALDIYRRALQIAPQNSTTLLYYTEALLADQQNKLARQTLHQIIAAPDDPAWLWEQQRDRRLARELLEKMDAAL